MVMHSKHPDTVRNCHIYGTSVRDDETGEIMFMFQSHDKYLIDKIQQIVADEIYALECPSCGIDVFDIHDHLTPEELKRLTIWSRKQDLLDSY